MKILIKTLLFIAFFHIFFSTLNNISKVREQRVQAENIFVTTQVINAVKNMKTNGLSLPKKVERN